jgi:glutathione S-transferase
LVAINALINHLNLKVERVAVDLRRGQQLAPQYIAINPNHKSPTLVDVDFALWEGNAILAYLAGQAPEAGLWPADLRAQTDVLRWLLWEAAHLDAESWGMVAFEKASKSVLGLGAPDPTFIARGEQNFIRFAGVLNISLKDRQWLVGETLTIADLAIGQVVPSARSFGLPVADFPEIVRWYDGLCELPGWQAALAEQDEAKRTLIAEMNRQSTGGED